MKRDGFVFYRSFYEAIACLMPDDQLELFHAICLYGLDGEEPELGGVADGMFRLVKPQLEANYKRYVNGKRGGRPPKETEEKATNNQRKTEEKPTENQAETKEEPKEKEKEKEKEKAKDKEKAKEKAPRFQKPTVQEVQQYVRENGYRVDAERFVDFYESKGWVVGKNPMRDWKAAVRNWSRREATPEDKHKASFDGDAYRKKAQAPIVYERRNDS